MPTCDDIMSNIVVYTKNLDIINEEIPQGIKSFKCFQTFNFPDIWFV